MSYLKDNPTVSIIIPSYNGRHLLKDCLSSLYELEYPGKQLDIKLIDNNSNDGTAQYVRRHFRKVDVLRNPENNYCKANNLGIKHSRSQLLAFLNNDTTVDRRWLRALVDSLIQDKKIGCVGSKVLFPDGKIQSTGHYEFPNFRWGDRGLREPDFGQYEIPEEMNGLSGSAVLFRRNCLNNVGGFDEDFVMFMEDVDIFLRCRQKGWKLLYVPDSVVYHKFHGTVDEKSVRLYIERNRLLLVAKHFPHGLSHAIESKEYSLSQAELFMILAEVVSKVIKHWSVDELNSILPNLFSSLHRLYDFSKDDAVQRLNDLLKESQSFIEEAQNKKAESENNLWKLQEELRQKNQQFEEEKQNLESVISKLDADKQVNSLQVGELKNMLTEQHNFVERILHDKSVLEDNLNQKCVDLEHLRKTSQELERHRNDLVFELSKSAEDVKVKDQVISSLGFELNETRHISKTLQTDLEHLRKTSQELERHRNDLAVEISKREEDIKAKNALIVELDSQMIMNNRTITNLKNEINLLQQNIGDLNNSAQTQSRILSEKDEFINKIFHSHAYRYIALPLWKISDFIKAITRRDGQKKILVIKPYYVSSSNAAVALYDFRSLFKGYKVTLLANVFKVDYDYLQSHGDYDEKILYSPDYNRLTKFKLIKLILRLNLKYFEQVIVLIGPCVYQGYRKAKLLAFASGATSLRAYFVSSKKLTTLHNLSITRKLKIGIEAFWHVFSFIGVMLFFVLFIVFPLKLRKLFNK